jgi:DNA-binding GntR family transcriptional regulator
VPHTCCMETTDKHGTPLLDGARQSDRTAPRGFRYGVVADELRDMITTGRLAPGGRLREQELCLRLGVSRTPLREAIRELASEGLIKLLPNRGAVVASMDAREIQSLYEVVGALECLAAELACERIRDHEIAELGSLHYQLVYHHLRHQLTDYFKFNQRIHRRIVEISDNPVLLWVWDMLALRVNRARYSTNLRPERWAEAVREHEEIFKAISARDGPRLAHILGRRPTPLKRLGDIRANGPVWITKSAKCNARVHAPSVQLDGTMKGTVHATNTMKLGPQCNMHGTIVADQLVCANGASFNGTCKIGRYRKAA